jgi:hypothetical protein
MRWNHFGGSLLFAALAALGFPAARLLFDPLFGAFLTTHFYLVATSGLYVLSMAPTLRRGIAAGAVVCLLGLWLMTGSSQTSQLSLGLAAGIAVARSAYLYRVRVARGVAVEFALALGGLLLASWFASDGMLGLSLALWSYFLAQSMYFPLCAVVPRRREQTGDAFDEASARLQALLREAEG